MNIFKGTLKEDVQKDYIIPTKRKLEANDGDIVKRQRCIDNACNSPEKEEMSEIQFTDNGWNCGGYKL